jgi:indole-3-glycerol phosphate synthase
MTILEEIISYKKKEVNDRKYQVPLSNLEKMSYFSRKTLPLTIPLQKMEKTGIIAEFKKKSPSKGMINETANLEEVVSEYALGGAAGISVLTDNRYFGGSSTDLIRAREKVQIPILRKDFIIDKYQISEAKGIGADVILLIAAALTPEQTYDLAKFAHDLDLQVLLEIHSQLELNYLNDYVDIVGVNNRDLKTFRVDIGISMELAALIPDKFVKISESGISDVETISKLKAYGYRGFLMGENFMKSKNPGRAFSVFVDMLNKE